jgi:hypothetical protein
MAVPSKPKLLAETAGRKLRLNLLTKQAGWCLIMALENDQHINSLPV